MFEESRVVLLGAAMWCVASAPAIAADWVVTTDTVLADTDTSHEGDDVVVRGATLTLNGFHVFRSLRVERSAGNVPGVVTHGMAFDNGIDKGMSIEVFGDLTVEGAAGGLVESAIRVDSRGYPALTGPGAGDGVNWPAGAGHGGAGGSSGETIAGSDAPEPGGATYGDVFDPVEFGSGGKGDPSYNQGGGRVQLVVKGEARIDGVVSANGGSYNGSGNCVIAVGSGGSILLIARRLSGSGRITADGGNNTCWGGGAGGGGRISLRSQTDEFHGLVSAYGGTGARPAGAGTIYRAPLEGMGEVIVDNGGRIAGTGWDGTTQWTSPSILEATLRIRGKGVVTPPRGQTLDLTVKGDLIIESDGALGADARGFDPGQGPGAGGPHGSSGSSGAGHGGRGGFGNSGSKGGVVYGDMFDPTTFGSGGGSGSFAQSSGGGALRLRVDGDVFVDGRLSVDAGFYLGGPNCGLGGGAGGSLSLRVRGSVWGTGEISALGGDDDCWAGGAGGGGRIAIRGRTHQFLGKITAHGGVAVNSGEHGGAGTVYLEPKPGAGVLIFDNDGVSAGTVWDGTSDWMGPAVIDADVIIRGAAQLSPPPGVPLQLEITGDLTIEAGASLSAQGRGHMANTGPGAGVCMGGSCSGGGHGGVGGASHGDPPAPGGGSYGDPNAPIELGSGGGHPWVDGQREFTAGGGAIQLVVGGVLHVDGSVSADGSSYVGGPNCGLGTGAGGSLYLFVRSLQGSGSITANGGTNQCWAGGSGGGGRIALYSVSGIQGFSGSITANGGAASAPGQASTDGTVVVVSG